MPPKKSSKKKSSTKRNADAADLDKPEVKEQQDGQGVRWFRGNPSADLAAPPRTKTAKHASPLEWLLSPEAFDRANPPLAPGHGEIDQGSQQPPPPDDAGKHSSANEEELRYPSSSLTPFQNLVCATILSKPLSHRLGLRTIATLLNPPFGLRTLADLEEAGYEGRRKVMWEARTQHKEKTASQLGDLVEGIKELCGDAEGDQSALTGVREKLKGKSTKEAQEEVRATLTKIKGIGPGGVAIFLRRVQGEWDEVYPFADDRGLVAAKRFGLVGDGGDAVALAKAVGLGDRGKLVKVLDVLVGLELEKVLDEAVEKAGV